eukprot:6196588-Pleurochrysis_carterae.AAC.4
MKCSMIRTVASKSAYFAQDVRRRGVVPAKCALHACYQCGRKSLPYYNSTRRAGAPRQHAARQLACPPGRTTSLPTPPTSQRRCQCALCCAPRAATGSRTTSNEERADQRNREGGRANLPSILTAEKGPLHLPIFSLASELYFGVLQPCFAPIAGNIQRSFTTCTSASSRCVAASMPGADDELLPFLAEGTPEGKLRNAGMLPSAVPSAQPGPACRAAVVRGLSTAAGSTAAMGIIIFRLRGSDGAMLFLASYLMELSLSAAFHVCPRLLRFDSVDNMFAFYLIFNFYSCPVCCCAENTWQSNSGEAGIANEKAAAGQIPNNLYLTGTTRNFGAVPGAGALLGDHRRDRTACSRASAGRRDHLGRKVRSRNVDLARMPIALEANPQCREHRSCLELTCCVALLRHSNCFLEAHTYSGNAVAVSKAFVETSNVCGREYIQVWRGDHDVRGGMRSSRAASSCTRPAFLTCSAESGVCMRRSRA